MSIAAVVRGNPSRRSTRAVRALRHLVDALERRQHLTSTPHALAGGALTQNWNNVGLITADDNWSGVPSFQGFLGDVATAITDVDAQTVLTSNTTLDVNANRTDPDSNPAGGVTEFESLAPSHPLASNPVVALTGSNTADAPYLVAYLNADGVNDVRIRYNVNDLEIGIDNAAQQLALHYRIGGTGNWINVPEAYIADATSVGTNPLSTARDIVLPAAANDQPLVEVRWLTTNVANNDEAIGIDDIQISGTPRPTAHGTFSFEQTAYSVSEGVGNATFVVKRINGNDGAVSVMYNTSGTTALPPGDYAASSDLLLFADGVESMSFTIPIVDDALVEGPETFRIILANNTGGATIDPDTGITFVTIVDNDSNAPAGLLLNEINISPPGADLPFQYVELRGAPNTVLSNIYFLEIEGDTGQNAGKINGILSLTNASGTATIGSNGLLLIRSANGFTPEAAGTGVFNTPLFTSGFDFQPGSASFVLIYHDPSIGTFDLSVGDDLDVSNTGTLTLPPAISALDGVGVLDGTNNDKAYGAIIEKLGTHASPDAADAVSRFFNNVTPNDAAAWFYGNLQGPASDTKAFSSVLSQRSPNFPIGGVLTPGGVMTGVVDVVLDYAGTSQSIVVTFSEDVSASLAAGDFELKLLGPGTLINLTLLNVSPDGTTARLGFSGTAGLSPNLLADGDYELRVKAGEVGDGTAVLPIDHTANVFFKNADLNHDRTVGFADLLTLAQNYGRTSGVTFATGDVNYDGAVNFADLLLLAQRYGTTLLTLPATKTAVVAKKRSGFGESVIA